MKFDEDEWSSKLQKHPIVINACENVVPDSVLKLKKKSKSDQKDSSEGTET